MHLFLVHFAAAIGVIAQAKSVRKLLSFRNFMAFHLPGSYIYELVWYCLRVTQKLLELLNRFK